LPANPSRKWGEPWFWPYDFSLSDGQVAYIDGIGFLVTGPHQGVTAFGKPYSYWEMTNQQEFLFYDGGGDWTQRVYAGHIILRYDAAASRLQTYSNVKRTEFFQGNPTNNTVQYIVQLIAADSFPKGNVRVNIETYLNTENWVEDSTEGDNAVYSQQIDITSRMHPSIELFR